MNPLTALIFILGLGSLSCYDFMTPQDTVHCIEQEKVIDKDLIDLEDKNIKCYYHCLFERGGLIANGEYRGNLTACKDVKDDDKCELAKKVVYCSNYLDNLM